jgi:L-Ala-D/L-Glu epimerase
MAAAAELGVALIEQPLPAGNDGILGEIPHPIPVCADESAHTSETLAALRNRYDAVNIKLDKTGGLTEALKMRDEARALGFQIMVGCMVGSSLAMAPAVLLAQGAEFVDLDGPLLLARDREPGLKYEGSLVYPPEATLWG